MINFLVGGGETGALMRSIDWAASPLGPAEDWPQSLKSAVSIMLPSSAQICMFWGPGLIALYNDAYAPAIGDKHPQALGRLARESWAATWDVLEPLLDNVMRTGEPFDSKSHHFQVDRYGFLEDIYFDVSYSPVRGEGDSIDGVFCIVSDRTQRVFDDRRLRTLREASLQSRTESLELAASSLVETLARENSTDCPYAFIYLFGGNGNLQPVAGYGAELSQNAKYIDLTAVEQDWAVCMASVAATDKAQLCAADGMLAATPDIASAVMRILPLKVTNTVIGLLIIGQNKHIAPDLEYFRFFDLLAGQVSAALATASALKDERHRARALEQQVTAAISERAIAEEQLRRAQKMEAIGKLTGGVAHDFNNLLQVVSGNLQLLNKDVAGNERAQRRVQNALAGVNRGSKLASQLLAFGRRQPLEPKVVNIGRFINGLDDILRHAIGEEIEIETATAGGLWNTLIDPSQIENALLNLAINARDAMDGYGKLTIEAGNAFLNDDYVRTQPDVTPGQYVMLAVTDTGCGMTPDIIEQVFEPFFTTKPEGKGTGLGLSMVYGFVKQSGGHIKIYSEPGHGTTIKLYLPRALQSEDVATELDSGPIIGGAETVLIVEDDEAVRATVVEIVGDLGYRVLKAKDAQSALAIIESGVAIDMLFTDVVMPGSLRSPELARKARERLPHIAVLFTSGYTENAIVHGGRLDEGVNLLTKPYTREALARKFRHVLANQAQRAFIESSAAQFATAPASTPELSQVKPLSILLVEDDSLIRMNTADILGELGHEVIEAENAETALEALRQAPIDVLLTDYVMPGMTGAELAEQALSRQPGIGIVFTTGHHQVPGLSEALRQRSMLLRKPYNRIGLSQILSVATVEKR